VPVQNLPAGNPMGGEISVDRDAPLVNDPSSRVVAGCEETGVDRSNGIAVKLEPRCRPKPERNTAALVSGYSQVSPRLATWRFRTVRAAGATPKLVQGIVIWRSE
jgi:hypothetical protein